MLYIDKIKLLEIILCDSESDYIEGFKQEIIMYFNDDFSTGNKQLEFLETFNTAVEIEDWVNKLISNFIMKFDAEGESKQDFIWDYLRRD